jgi:hypothetical protein
MHFFRLLNGTMTSRKDITGAGSKPVHHGRQQQHHHGHNHRDRDTDFGEVLEPVSAIVLHPQVGLKSGGIDDAHDAANFPVSFGAFVTEITYAIAQLS